MEPEEATDDFLSATFGYDSPRNEIKG